MDRFTTCANASKPLVNHCTTTYCAACILFMCTHCDNAILHVSYPHTTWIVAPNGHWHPHTTSCQLQRCTKLSQKLRCCIVYLKILQWIMAAGHIISLPSLDGRAAPAIDYYHWIQDNSINSCTQHCLPCSDVALFDLLLFAFMPFLPCPRSFVHASIFHSKTNSGNSGVIPATLIQ